MPWIILVLAGLLEVGWAIGLKYTEGFTRLWPSVGTVVAMVLSLGLLGIAMKSLPVGTAYAVWVGVGAVGTGDLPRVDDRDALLAGLGHHEAALGDHLVEVPDRRPAEGVPLLLQQVHVLHVDHHDRGARGHPVSFRGYVPIV